MSDYGYDEQEEMQQASGPNIKPCDDTVNHLMLIWTVGYNPDAPSKYVQPGKQSDCVYVDVVDLDQRDENGMPGLLARHQWWYPGFLVGFLKTRVGNQSPVLAYLTHGQATKGKPPYHLVPAHTLPEARERANEWRSRHPDFVPGQRGVAYDDTTVAPVASPRPAAAPVPAGLAALQAQQAQPEDTMSQLQRLAAQSRAAAGRLAAPPQPSEPPF